MSSKGNKLNSLCRDFKLEGTMVPFVPLNDTFLTLCLKSFITSLYVNYILTVLSHTIAYLTMVVFSQWGFYAMVISDN